MALELLIIDGTDRTGKTTTINSVKSELTRQGIDWIDFHNKDLTYPKFTDIMHPRENENFYMKQLEYLAIQARTIKQMWLRLGNTERRTIVIADRMHYAFAVYNIVNRPALTKRYFNKVNMYQSVYEFEYYLLSIFDSVNQFVFVAGEDFKFNDDLNHFMYKMKSSKLREVNEHFKSFLETETKMRIYKLEVDTATDNSGEIIKCI